MSRKDSHADLVAAYLAKGGKVKRVAEDASNGMTARDWYLAARGDLQTAESDEQIAEREAERVREAYHVGGRTAALDELNHIAAENRRKESR